MKRKIVVGLILAIVFGTIWVFMPKSNPPVEVSADLVFEPSSETGFVAEKVVGDLEEAKVVIFEYADFGCSHCAEWNEKINSLMEEYDGKLALVFRNYNLGFKNGPLAASAATAAHIQGYFNEYKDLLFLNQGEWFYEDGEELEDLFVGYFRKVSGGSGDIGKFKEDLKSDAVRTRLEFEQKMGKSVNLTGTPTFRIDGETIELKGLEEVIREKAEK